MNIPPLGSTGFSPINEFPAQNSSNVPIFYDATSHGNAEDFLKSELGQRCLNQLVGEAVDLAKFCWSSTLYSETPQLWEFLVGNLSDFAIRLGGLKGHGLESTDFLGQGKRALHELRALVRDSGIPSDLKLSALSELCRSLTVCAPGVITAIRDATRTLTPTPNFVDALAKVRNQVATQAIQRLVGASVAKGELPAGNEVHYVNAYLSVYASFFKLDVFEDSLAPESLPAEGITNALSSLHQALLTGNLLVGFSDDFQALIANRLYEELKLPLGSALHLTPYEALKIKLDDILHEESSRHGFYVEPEKLFEFVNDDCDEFRISTKSSKVLQHLVILCQRHGLEDLVPVEITRLTTAEDGVVGKLLNLCRLADREWIETGDLLLGTKHREKVRNVEISDLFLLLNKICTGRHNLLGSIDQICKIFLDLTSSDEVRKLGFHFAEILHRFEGENKDVCAANHQLVFYKLMDDPSFSFKEALLKSQIERNPGKALFYLFSLPQLHGYLNQYMSMGCPPDVLDSDGFSILQRSANSNLMAFFEDAVIDFGCNPFSLNAKGAAFSEYAGAESLQKFLFSPAFASRLQNETDRLQAYFEQALNNSYPHLHPKILSEAGLFLAEGQTLVYQNIPLTSAGLLKKSFELNSQLPVDSLLDPRFFRAVHLLLAKQASLGGLVREMPLPLLADPLWAYINLGCSSPEFPQAKFYENLLQSPFHHLYEKKHDIFPNSKLVSLDVSLHVLMRSREPSKDLQLLMKVCKHLRQAAAGEGALNRKEIHSLLPRMYAYLQSFENDHFAWALVAHMHLSCERYLSSVSDKGMSAAALVALQRSLALNLTQTHAWSLLAEHWKQGPLVLVNNEMLTRADFEVRAYAYTPIDPDTGNTIMHTVARRRDEATLRRLVDFGCDINAKNLRGLTPAELVRLEGDFAFADLMVDEFKAAQPASVFAA